MTHFGTNWRADIITAWLCFGVAGAFIFARIMTRYYLGPDRLGYDDWVLLAAWIVRIITRILVTASFYPLTQGSTAMDIYMNAYTYRVTEMLLGMGLLVGYFGEALCLASVSLFLVRIAFVRWHKILLLGITLGFTVFSLITGSIFLVCLNETSSDVTKCVCYPVPNTTMVALVFEGMDIPLTFFLAAFPWYMLYDVRMKRSKKLVICCSLSLGVFSGGIGIWRVFELSYGTSSDDALMNDLLTNVKDGLFFVCVCIPALLPLYYLLQQRRHGGGGDQQPVAPRYDEADVQRRKRGDSIIHDPRMEALLVDTVPTGRDRPGDVESQIIKGRMSETKIIQADESMMEGSTGEGNENRQSGTVGTLEERKKAIPDNWD